MTYSIPLPRVLNSSMQELRRLNVSDASVTLNITPLSTATITMPDTETLNMRDWVQMFTSGGSAGVFRVHAPGQNFDRQNKVYQLDHGVAEIGDYICKGEIELNGAANTVIGQIFSHYAGSMWQLGTLAATKTVSYSGDYENVLTAILNVMNQLPEYMLTFDQTRLPWRLNVVQRPQTVSGEGRLSRNIESCRITEDDSNLCTRLYGEGLGTNGYIDADTIGTYGVVEYYVSKDEDQDAAQFVADAQEYLSQHKRPLLSVSVSLLDLQQITGEALDGVTLGSLYRLALPDYNITHDQTVVALQYSSVYGKPGSVTVTLANEEKTMSSVFHSASASSASAQKKQNKINDQFGGAIKGNTEQLTIQSNKIDVVTHDLSVTAGDLNTVKLQVNDQGIRLSAEETATENMNQRINAAEVTVTAQGVRIAASETNIDLLAETQTQQEATITTMAGQIQLKASQSSVDALGNRVTNAESSITQNAQQIELKVAKDGIVSAINQTAETIKISANKINLEGYVTATQFEAEQARLTNIVSGNTSVAKIVGVNANFSDLIVTNSIVYGPHNVDLTNAVATIGPATASGGKITIPWTMLNGTAGESVNFNIADTQYYKNGVSAAWTNAYNTVRINNNKNPGAGNKTINLGSGQSVEVYAQAKDNANASIWTTVGTVTVNAPTYTLGSLSISSNGIYNAPTYGYTGFSYVSVDVPSSSVQFGSVRSRSVAAVGASVYVNYSLDGGNTWRSYTATVQEYTG